MNAGPRADPLPSGPRASDASAAAGEFLQHVGCGMTPVFVVDPTDYLRGVRAVLLAGSAIAVPILWLMTA